MYSISAMAHRCGFGDSNRDRRPLAGLTAPGHLPAEQRGPLAHSQKTDGLRVVNLRLGYAAPIVLDLQFQPAFVFGEAHFDPRCAGVANYIRECLLKYPEECCVEVRIPVCVFNGGFDTALDAGLALELMGLPFDRRFEAGGVEHAWPQFRRNPSNRLDGVINARSHVLRFLL